MTSPTSDYKIEDNSKKNHKLGYTVNFIKTINDKKNNVKCKWWFNNITS
jgi:hypothetical protein